jgi:hypothetical protein
VMRITGLRDVISHTRRSLNETNHSIRRSGGCRASCRAAIAGIRVVRSEVMFWRKLRACMLQRDERSG